MPTGRGDGSLDSASLVTRVVWPCCGWPRRRQSEQRHSRPGAHAHPRQQQQIKWIILSADPVSRYCQARTTIRGSPGKGFASSSLTWASRLGDGLTTRSSLLVLFEPVGNLWDQLIVSDRNRACHCRQPRWPSRRDNLRNHVIH